MMKKKYKKINLVLTIIPVMVVILLLIAGSYAIFSTDLNPTKVHTLTIGDLYAAKLSITDDGYVNLINAVPLSNDLGMKGDATNLTLENVGDITATYSIILLDDKTEYANYSGSVLPDSVIKYGITRNHNVNSTISLLSNATEYCSDSSIATYSACKSSSTAESGRVIMTGKLVVGESVDYKLRLWINYNAGNAYQENRYYGQVKVIIGKDLEIDTNKPYIVLNGDSEVSLEVGENYYEEGILAALDKEDGDVSNTLSITDNVDTSTPGIYRVSYSVHDSNNQYGFATRTVIVKNPTDCGITFTIVGDNPLSQLLGTTYVEQGAAAVDSSNNSLTVTSNSVGLDVDTIGQYHIIYSATSGTCTDYTYRLVEVTMGSGGYITYSPDGTNNVWSSDSITASINVSNDITGVTPASIKYKIGRYVNDNITYGNEVTVLASALPTTYTFSSSGEYIISTTLVTTTSLEIKNLMSQKYFIDKTSPSCGTPTYTSSPTLSDPATWVSTNRSISITSCTDSHSGCNGSSLSKIFSETSQTGTITIRDKASPNPNTATCMVNVYVDKTPPECGTITNANTTWAKTLSNSISVECSDTQSGCYSSSFSNSFTGYTGQTGIITIKDNSSPNNTASCTVNTYLDNATPAAPTVAGTVASNTWATSNTITISGSSALSGIASYKYCVASSNSSSGCTWSTYSSSNKPSYSTTQTKYIFAKAVSGTNKESAASSVYIVKIDVTPPATCTLTSSGTNFVLSGSDDQSGIHTTAPYSFTSASSGFSNTNSIAASDSTSYTGWIRDALGNTKSCSKTCTAWTSEVEQNGSTTSCTNGFTSTTTKISDCTAHYACRKQSTCSSGTKTNVSGTYYCQSYTWVTNGGPCQCTNGVDAYSLTCAQLAYTASSSGTTKSCSTLCRSALGSAWYGTGTSCSSVQNTVNVNPNCSSGGTLSSNKYYCEKTWQTSCSSGWSQYGEGRVWQSCTRTCE